MKNSTTRTKFKNLFDDKSDKANTNTKAQENALLAEKQPVIGVDDLAISMTNGMLDAIDSKRNLLPAEDCITIHQVTTLETLLADLAPKTSVCNQHATDLLLATKQNTITTNALSIGMTNGLTAALKTFNDYDAANDIYLAAKQPTITTNSLSIGMTNGLTAALNTLTDDDIANNVNLAAKQPTVTTNSLSI